MRYDTVWAKLEESGIPVAFHLSDSGYNGSIARAWGAPARFVPFRTSNPLANIVVSDRAIHDTMASLILGGVFTRHPKLRVASIENGSDWVQLLVKRLKKQANQTHGHSPSRPSTRSAGTVGGAVLRGRRPRAGRPRRIRSRPVRLRLATWRRLEKRRISSRNSATSTRVRKTGSCAPTCWITWGSLPVAECRMGALVSPGECTHANPVSADVYFARDERVVAFFALLFAAGSSCSRRRLVYSRMQLSPYSKL